MARNTTLGSATAYNLASVFFACSLEAMGISMDFVPINLQAYIFVQNLKTVRTISAGMDYNVRMFKYVGTYQFSDKISHPPLGVFPYIKEIFISPHLRYF